ncbi:ssk1 response regulator receiver, partial [Modicella reniformis]
MAQVAYHGIFATTCSWQWVKRLALDSKESVDNNNDINSSGGSDGINDSEATESIHVSDPSISVPAENNNELQDASAASPLAKAVSTSLSYCILGYGLLGFFGFSPTLAARTWGFYFWNPILILATLSPLVMGLFLLGLDKISIALSKDETRHESEVNELQKSHEVMIEAYREEYLYQKNMLLETVGKEVQDAATLAIETLRQMTPSILFPPSISREQLSPCALPLPITSILGLFTTMRHLQYISRNMQRLSRVMFTEIVQGIVEKSSPHYHRGQNKFDVGEFVQSLGDLMSADASLKGVEFVIYHSEYELNHVHIRGSEESWRHALINLIKSIVDCAKSGSTIELCLVLLTITRPENERDRVMVSFEITYYPNPDSNAEGDYLAELDVRLASKLVKAMGGSLVIEPQDRPEKFTVSVEVELSQFPQEEEEEEEAGNPRQIDDQHRPIHPLEPSSDVAQLVATPEHLQRLENMQTAHPIHESQQFFQQHIKTPLVSPSPPPTSPPPRRANNGSSQKVSVEPTISELIRFSHKLAGQKVVLMAKEHSAFAVHLSGYLKVWSVNVLKKTIRESPGASAKMESGDVFISDEPQSGGAKRTNSSSSLTGKHSNLPGKSESLSSSSKSPNPIFIMIDDDVKVLGQQILKMQSNPPSPAPAAGSKRNFHRRTRSVTSVQHTTIIYFTSLPTFKQAREAIMVILGPNMNYNISSSGQGSLPFIFVLPKPAGPRRVLTAMHTAINVPVLDHPYSPIATAPTSPAPAIRHFSEEINPLDRDQIVYDPVSNQAFARTVPHSTQSSPGGLSPNNTLPPDQRQKRDLMRQLIDAGGNPVAVVYPFDHTTTDVMSPETPGSVSLVGSPTGIIVPGTGGQPAGIQFDPTARPAGTLSPALVNSGHRRISNGSARHSISSNESGTVVIPPTNGTQNHQSFAQMHAQRASENVTSPTNFIRLNNGQLLRPGAGRSPLSTPPTITQSNGLLFSPPSTRHSGMASPLPQRPEPAATRNVSNGSGSMSSH